MQAFEFRREDKYFRNWRVGRNGCGGVCIEVKASGSWQEPAVDTQSALAALDALMAALTEARAPKWRCYHCDFETSDKAAAEVHFGEDGGESPLCLQWAKMTEDEKLVAWKEAEEALIREREIYATELDEARAENARLREALKEISHNKDCLGPGCPYCEDGGKHPDAYVAIIARAALAPKETNDDSK